MSQVFVERVPQLRAIEGWYGEGVDRFKLSCRFNDILRCSEFNDKSQHFNSCFREGGQHEIQPRLRCFDPTWAIIYMPDKHGNFLGRCFVQWKDGKLKIGKIYGNKLRIEKIMENFIQDVDYDPVDTYLPTESE